MSLFIKAKAIYMLLKWKRGADKFDLDRKPPVSNPKFMTAREAVRLIPDNGVVMSNGMTGTMRPAILYRAVREVFLAEGRPKNLTWIHPGGGGGRGKVPGTMEEMGLDGLITCYISGHLETAKKLLAMAAEDKCEIVVLPQGTLIHCAEAQSKGEDSVLTHVGLGTFMDPRVGLGSVIIPGKSRQLVEPEGDKLRYRLPKINAACVTAVAADTDGNIYLDGAPIYGESVVAPRAARANGGVAIVTVAKIVPRDDSKIMLRAEEVDAIVVNPTNEMTLTVPQLKAWPELQPGGKADVRKAAGIVRAINDILKLDPPRGPVEQMLARQTAKLYSEVVKPHNHTIVGYGLPQEAGRLMYEGGLGKELTFLLETGVYGGVPAPGIFFGTAFAPKSLMSSAEMFHYVETNLDVTMLGMLQVDNEGNVNVSKKADGAANYIGPGGFCNLVANAKTIIFVGAFTAKSKMDLNEGTLTMTNAGIPKFVEKVEEITFAAKPALDQGKLVYYVTPVGTFMLTREGLKLVAIAPGIDPQKDIVANSRAKIVVPDGPIPTYDPTVMTGNNFKLTWKLK